MSKAPVTADPPNRSVGRTVARNTVFALGAQLSLKAAGFIFTILVVRNLGGDNFGQYQTILAWAGLFSVLGDVGISQYLTREIARDRSKSAELFWDIFALRMILALVAAVVTIVGAIAANYETNIVIGIALYTSSYFLQSLLQPMISVLDGNERLDVTSVFNVISQVVFLVMGTLFLLAGFSFVWLVVAEILRLPIVLFLAFRSIRRFKLTPPPFKVNSRIWLSLLRAGVPFALVQLSLTFAYQFDTVLLSQQVSNEHIGWYRMAYNLIFTLIALPQAFNSAMQLSLAREHAVDPTSVLPWYYRSVKMMVFITLPIAVGGTVLADKIIGSVFGPENLPAAIILAMIIWDLPFLIYNNFCGNMTTVIKHERSAARIFGSEGVLNVVLNLFLIPRFGIIGSTFATILTDLSGSAQFYLLFRREFGRGLELLRIIKIGIAAVLMGVLVYFLRDWNLLLSVPLAAVFYLVLVWNIGVFTTDERGLLTGMVIRRLRRTA